MEHIDEPGCGAWSWRHRRLKDGETAEMRHIAKRYAPTAIWLADSIWCSAFPESASAPRWRSSIRMPELGRVSREEAAALAGLAPFDDDSGEP